MRSELIFSAMAHISNRYLLSRFAAKAIRQFHRPNTRIEDTTNDVLVRFSHSNPIAAVRSGRQVGRVRLAGVSYRTVN